MPQCGRRGCLIFRVWQPCYARAHEAATIAATAGSAPFPISLTRPRAVFIRTGAPAVRVRAGRASDSNLPRRWCLMLRGNRKRLKEAKFIGSECLGGFSRRRNEIGLEALLPDCNAPVVWPIHLPLTARVGLSAPMFVVQTSVCLFVLGSVPGIRY